MPYFKIPAMFSAIPEIALLCLAAVLLVAGAVKGPTFLMSQLRLTIFGLLFILTLCLLSFGMDNIDAFHNMFIHNNFTAFSKLIMIVATLIALLLCQGFYRNQQKLGQCELPILMLFALLGMMVMVSANNLLILYLGIELQSLALYVLASSHYKEQRSSEAGLKYFILGAIASGILLYGCSLIYGFAGTIEFDALANHYSASTSVPIGELIGLILVISALCFKTATVPFHMWAPDVYEGAPTPITAFFATAPKIAALALFIRVIMGPFLDLAHQWQQVIVLISLASIIIGALGAIRQNNIKRLLAYSSISHAGYALMGLASANKAGIAAMLLYLVIYAITVAGIFACILMLKYRSHYNEKLTSFSGLAKTKPLIALSLAVLLFSMAGIPPFAGFFGKFYIFLAAIEAKLYIPATLGIISSVIAAFYYIRVVKIMYFEEGTITLDKTHPKELRYITAVSAAFNVCFVLSFAPLLSLTETAASSIVP